MTVKFDEVVKARKVSACTSCATYIYTLSINLTKDIGDFLLPFGKLSYNLEKCSIIRIDNEIISISEARVGTNSLRVKFKKDKQMYKELFDIHIAAFIESKTNETIDI